MKKLSVWKKLQLAVLLLISIASVVLALKDDLFYENMQGHPTAFTIYVLMWSVLVLCFFFLFLDFMFLNKIKLDYSTLNQVAYSDHLSGIPNRFSCDILLDKYADIDAPDNLGCVMLDITNLTSINQSLGHSQGNELIKDFSDILSSAALALCFVGRNGGNKFLAIFEDCTKEKIDLFLDRIDGKVQEHNEETPQRTISYKTGLAYNSEEKLKSITALISLANRRIYE